MSLSGSADRQSRIGCASVLAADPSDRRSPNLHSTRALVIGNGADLDAGFVGHRFRERGYAFTECHREAPGEWPDPDTVELVLTLGSEWNVYDPATAELVEQEAAFTRRVLAADVPLFAICFGAQVLAHALGATVERIDQPEIGWFDVTPTTAGAGIIGDVADKEARPPTIAAGPWMEWHYDGFDVPSGFDELARTAAGPQLIVGARVLATQFHPEVTETMVARWLHMGGAEQYRQHGGEPTELLAQTRANTELSRPNSAALVDFFLSEVAHP